MSLPVGTENPAGASQSLAGASQSVETKELPPPPVPRDEPHPLKAGLERRTIRNLTETVGDGAATLQIMLDKIQQRQDPS